MYFESHLLAIKQFAAHIPFFVRHNLFCDYFMSHKRMVFVVSNTRLPEVGWWDGGMTKEQFEERHVLFQQEDKGSYIEKMLRMAVT